MADFDFAYLLNAVPGSLNARYPEQALCISISDHDNKATRMFVSYDQGPTTVSYQTAARRFTSFCFKHRFNLSARIYLIAATKANFLGLFHFAATLACKRLWSVLSTQLNFVKILRVGVRNKERENLMLEKPATPCEYQGFRLANIR